MDTHAISNNGLLLEAPVPPENQRTVSRDDFLRLLIAQMSNQDPLSPLDNQEFAAQLAQFSSLEQLQSIDENIEYGVNMDLVLTQTINNTLAATIIGKQALANGDIVVYDEAGTASLTFSLDQAAQEVEITITDSAGSEVRTLQVGPLSDGDHTITWDGKNANGQELPQGEYHFTVKAVDTSGNDVAATTMIRGVVTGVRYEEGSAVLLIGRQEVPFTAVLEIGVTDDNG
jgi:flagellar basal-body rod modification protein FlgD